MKIENYTLSIETRRSFEFVDITDRIQGLIKESRISRGFTLVRSRHTTGAIACTEADSSIHNDANNLLDCLMPVDFSYEHSYEGRINGRAHQAEMLGFGCTTWAPVCNGRIELGTWQRIFFVELYQPMVRNIDVVIVGE